MLLSTSVDRPVRSASPPQTASAAASVQPPCEDGEAREERLLVGAEQVVAPVDRRAERLLARGQVARAAGEEVEALLEPGEQRLRGEQLGARGGELDREREAVEADADLGDRGRVRVRHGEVGLDGAGALDEERDRLVLRERRDRRAGARGRAGRAAAPGTRARRRGGAGMRLVTSSFSCGASREQVGERGRRLDEVLEVVEDEQEPLLGEEAPEALGERERRRSP